MNNAETNPFAEGTDRHVLWEMLVRLDIDAFLAADWSAVEDCFCRERFFAVDAGHRSSPDDWNLGFSNLNAYRDSWLAQATDFAATEWQDDPRSALFAATDLSHIEIRDDAALLHKKFCGSITRSDGGKVSLDWQTLYHGRKIDGRWRIVGFTGYLPRRLGEVAAPTSVKHAPAATQHITAGPYSPVLEIHPGKLVVICGQAAILPDGSVSGKSIEEQTTLTLDNCEAQLAQAGCTFADVFKVNVYLTNLDEWPRFNAVYASRIPEPRPVRTAVGTCLLPGLIVEVEMWAVLPF